MKRTGMTYILLLLVMVLAVGFRTILTGAKTKEEVRMELVQKGKELYIQKRFPEAISILADYFFRNRLDASIVDLDEPFVKDGMNLLADCWWSNGQYHLAMENYLYAAELIRDDYSEYIFTVLIKIIPPKERYGIHEVRFPLFALEIGPEKHTVLHAVLKMMDRFDQKEEVNLKEWAPKWSQNFKYSKDMTKLEWTPAVLEYYQDLITEEDLLKQVPRHEMGAAYFYIGLKYEIGKDWPKAEAWYKRAADEPWGIEPELAKNRMGRFSFLEYYQYTKNVTYEASSALISNYQGVPRIYHVSNLFDNDPATAWVEGVENAVGEWIEITLEKDVQTIKGFQIMNGHNKSEDLFHQNSRVKTLEVLMSDGTSQIFAIEDKMGMQEFTFQSPKNVDWVRFVIKEEIKGTKYNDLCISELKLVLK
jgi:hypothetical protein